MFANGKFLLWCQVFWTGVKLICFLFLQKINQFQFHLILYLFTAVTTRDTYGITELGIQRPCAPIYVLLFHKAQNVVLSVKSAREMAPWLSLFVLACYQGQGVTHNDVWDYLLLSDFTNFCGQTIVLLLLKLDHLWTNLSYLPMIKKPGFVSTDNLPLSNHSLDVLHQLELMLPKPKKKAWQPLYNSCGCNNEIFCSAYWPRFKIDEKDGNANNATSLRNFQTTKRR